MFSGRNYDSGSKGFGRNKQNPNKIIASYLWILYNKEQVCKWDRGDE
jgi:hypothetical protein